MKEPGSKPRAVVVGIDTLGLGLVRSLARSRVEVSGIIDSSDNLGRRTRFGKKVVCMNKPVEELVETLLSLGKQTEGRAALFLTSDADVQRFSEIRERLTPFYEMNLPGRQLIRDLLSKKHLAEYARRHKVPTPTTRFARGVQEVREVSRGIEFPCVLKPTTQSVRWKEAELEKVYKADSAEELLQLFEKVRPFHDEFVIQEWVPGGDEQVYFCLGYWPKGSCSPITFTGRKLRQWGGYTSVAEPCENREVEETTLRFFDEVRYRGFGSMEFKWYPRLQRFLMIEPTVGRVDLQFGLTDAAGLNIPFLACCDMLGIEPPRHERPVRKAKWIYEVYELYAARSYIRSGQLSFFGWLKSLKGSRAYALFMWSDPLPFLTFVFRLVGMRLKRVFRATG